MKTLAKIIAVLVCIVCSFKFGQYISEVSIYSQLGSVAHKMELYEQADSLAQRIIVSNGILERDSSLTMDEYCSVLEQLQTYSDLERK